MGKYTQAIVAALDLHWGTHHRAPTIRELMDLAGCPSSSHVKVMLGQLETAGRIKIDGARPIPLWVVRAINGARALDEGV